MSQSKAKESRHKARLYFIQKCNVSLSRILASIPDPRKAKCRRYRLHGILFMIFIGMCRGAMNGREAYRLSMVKCRGWLKRNLGFSRVPHHSIFTRIMRVLDAQWLQDAFTRWLLF